MTCCAVVQSKDAQVERFALAPDLLRTIQGEFAEMPGMRLTEAQFRRLWALDPVQCQGVTAALVRQGVLTRDASGRYCRRDDLGD
jgi:hypothetical protein